MLNFCLILDCSQMLIHVVVFLIQMDNGEDPTSNESNISSSESNSLPIPVPVTISSTNSNTEEGNPPSRCNKRKTSQIWDHFK